jgi:hypothetical protein
VAVLVVASVRLVAPVMGVALILVAPRYTLKAKPAGSVPSTRQLTNTVLASVRMATTLRLSFST